MDAQDWTRRLARGALMAIGIAFAVTALFLAMEVAADDSSFLYGPAFPNSETFGVYFGIALFPALVLIPLPVEYRWVFATVRGLSAGAAFALLGFAASDANPRSDGSVAFSLFILLVWVGVSLLYVGPQATQDPQAVEPPAPPEYHRAG